MSRLNSNIIDETKQLIYVLCAHHCAVHRFCVAINYKENVKGNETNCQLTNTTNHTFNETARKKDKIWTFRKFKRERSIWVSGRDWLTSWEHPNDIYHHENLEETTATCGLKNANFRS